MDLNQIAFIIFLLASLGFFAFTCYKVWLSFKIAKRDNINRLTDIPRRITLTLLVAFGQQKMFKRPVAGLFHALIWWGFLVITIGTIEIIIDGVTGQERILGFLGGLYSFIMVSGEIFAVIIILSCFVFLSRRYIIKPKRLEGREMQPSARLDATFVLITIFFLMVSLLGMNMGYIAVYPETHAGYFPVSAALNNTFSGALPADMHVFERVNWWIHIVLVLGFLNYLPYSKHFHVIMAVPNVFLSRLYPNGKLNNMPEITREIEIMMNPDAAAQGGEEAPPPSKFGAKDVNDLSWKNLMDSYSCTECGRCTAACPANITGKLLSPRKIMKDTRARLSEVANNVAKHGEGHDDGKALLGDYITVEELRACTTCNACVEECPVNINPVDIIMELRRNLVMEESNSPNEWNVMFSNVENNGAPWQFSQQDRMKWTEELEDKA